MAGSSQWLGLTKGKISGDLSFAKDPRLGAASQSAFHISACEAPIATNLCLRCKLAIDRLYGFSRGAVIKAMLVTGVINSMVNVNAYLVNICSALSWLALLSPGSVVFRSKSRHKLRHLAVAASLPYLSYHATYSVPMASSQQTLARQCP
jgi:hypothetical protein